MIRNYSALIKGSTQTQQARCIVLDLINATLKAIDPKHLVRKALKYKNRSLHLARKQIGINDVNGIYVIGAGKATGRMAEAVEAILKDHISGGLIIVPETNINDYKLDDVQVHGGGHPFPTKSSINATQALLAVVSQSPADALVISLFSGGGSALLALPAPSITHQDLHQTTKMLLFSGLPIDQINTVRKHLSQVKGGQLALHVYPRHHWSLLISDIPGDQLDMIASGPTLPDPTTYQMVSAIFGTHQLWQHVPQSVHNHIKSGIKGQRNETPKPHNPIFSQNHLQLIGSNRTACEAAQLHALQYGIKARILTTDCQGEARNIGTQIAQIACNLTKSNHAFIIGSETTVTLKHPGKGGRNTELLTAALPGIQNQKGLIIASISTDGLDGNTPYAGGIIDGSSFSRASILGLDTEQVLEQNNTFSLFDALGDHIDTGPTHTNVRDLTLILRAN